MTTSNHIEPMTFGSGFPVETFGRVDHTTSTVPRPRIGGSKALGMLSTQRWLLRETTLDSLCSVLVRHASGNKLEASEIESIIAARDSRCEDRRESMSAGERPLYTNVGGVAAIPVGGLIVKYANLVNGASQPRGTSMEALKRALRQAKRDDSVESIVLDIDSPGGSSADVAETADLIRRIDTKDKPVYAVVEGGDCCSAAFWLAAATRRIYATNGSEIGSIGVWSVMVDESAAAEAEGVKVHVLRYGEHKAIGMIPGEEVTQEAIDHHQKGINTLGDMFVDAVRKFRGMDSADARAVADGSVHYARDAKRIGLVDEIVRDFEHAIARIGADQKGNTGDGARRASSADREEEKGMSEQNAPIRYESVEQLAEAQPELAAALRARGAEDERKRISAIHAMTEAGQESVAQSCIDSGASEDEARKRLHEDLRTRSSDRLAKISETRKEIGTPDGFADEDTAEIKDSAAAPSDATDFERKALKSWEANEGGCRNTFGGQFALYLSKLENDRGLAEGRGSKKRGA